jgi:hypothetical protein
MLNEATRDFIHQHLEADVRQLALQGGRDSGVDLPLALEQIAGRQKARAKIPSWAAIDGILYPPHLSMEQCSSERTARYKAGIAGKGELFVDLTTGFGVDAAFISKGFSKAVCIEQQERLCTIILDNFKRLGLSHVHVVCGDGIEYLHQMDHADLLFVDPARRDEHGARTFGIADCTPNVLKLMDKMTEKATRIIIKLSPMLDWRKAVEDIGDGVSCVHIVSVDNECKELLIEVKSEERKAKSEASSLRVVCVNLLSDGQEERFEFNAKASFPTKTTCFAKLSGFLYEPNASIMKAGCFGLFAERFSLSQLDSNSHLFVSDADIDDFPGRRFVIDKVTSMNKRNLKEALAGISRANIAVRNFPMSVAELRKRLKLQDGGDEYIFATTVANLGHRLFVCRKKP